MATSEIDLLKQQQNSLYEQINAINQGQATGDIAALQEQLNTISNQISVLESAQTTAADTTTTDATATTDQTVTSSEEATETDNSAATEQVTTAESESETAATVTDPIEEEAIKEVSALFAAIDWDGYTAKDLFINYTEEKAEASLNLVLSIIQNAVVSTKLKDLQDIQELNDKVTELNSNLASLKLQLSDAESKRDAAATQLEEAQAEISRLNSQVDDLRKEAAVGASNVPKIIDTRSAAEIYEEQRRKEEESKIVIYDVKWKDMGHRQLSAKVAETDEEITLSYYEIQGDPDKVSQTALKSAKYKVVSAEQATTFRTEYLAKQTAAETGDVGADQSGATEVEAEPVTVPAFQGSSEETTDSTAGGLVDSTSDVVGTTVTREEFAALEARVKALESVNTQAVA